MDNKNWYKQNFAFVIWVVDYRNKIKIILKELDTTQGNFYLFVYHCIIFIYWNITNHVHTLQLVHCSNDPLKKCLSFYCSQPTRRIKNRSSLLNFIVTTLWEIIFFATSLLNLQTRSHFVHKTLSNKLSIMKISRIVR